MVTLAQAPSIDSLIGTAVPVTDIAEVLRYLHPDNAFELRIIGKEGIKAVGTWDNPTLAAAAVGQYDGKVNCYVTLNPIGQAENRFTNGAGGATKDSDIPNRRWLLVDLDPKRESKTAATAEELEAAGELAVRVSRWLGWQAGAIGMSGNGYHLLYRLDVPNTKEATAVIRALLDTLSIRFLNTAVGVDTTVYNPSRITKLYGTLSTKGENTPERPFRRSGLYPLPNPQVVTLADIVDILPTTALPPTQPPNPTPNPNGNTSGAIISGGDVLNGTNGGDIAAYLDCLSVARADDYQQWITVGAALHHSLGAAGLPLWEAFSQRSDKYKQGDCAKRWEGLGDEPSDKKASLLTIYLWAKEDNPTIYKELTKANYYANGASPNGHGRAVAPTVAPVAPKAGGSEDILPPTADCPFVGLERLRMALNGQDLGDGELFGDLFRGRVVYDFVKKQWYLWGGHYWQEDNTAQIKLLFTRSVSKQYLLGAAAAAKEGAGLLSELAKIKGEKGREHEVDKLEERKKKLETAERLFTERADLRRRKTPSANALDFAASCLPFVGKWDSNPLLLGVENCVVELDKGTGRKGLPSDYIRTIAPVEWEGIDKPCPRFQRFVYEIMGEWGAMTEKHTPLSDFLQRLLGYAIAGLTTEHVFPIFWGEEGRNGKDTLLETLQGVLGDYAGSISKDVILQKRQGGAGQATPHVMQLKGKRLAWASEPDEGVRIDAGMVKLFSGGAEVNGRELYGKNETFKQTALVLLVTNPRPKTNADDSALWERVKLVEFNQRFLTNPNPTKPNEHKADTRLKETLDKERSGILAWLVRGFMAWQEVGMLYPTAVQFATEKYRQEEDTLGVWLEESCVVTPNAQTKGSELYANYKAWAAANGLRELSSVNFGKKLKRRFSHRLSGGVVYEGVGLLALQ